MRQKPWASALVVAGLLLLGVPAFLILRNSVWMAAVGPKATSKSAELAAVASLPQLYGYVANMGEDTVSVIDLVSNTEVDRVPVGAGPYEVALSPDERWAVVTNSFTDTVSLIDTSLNQESAKVRVGNLPRGLAIHSGGLAFVANSGEATMSVIDLGTRQVMTTVVGFPSNVWDVAVSPDGRYAYLSNEGGSGDVYQVDTSSWQVTSLISGVSGCGAGLAVSPDGDFLYLADPCGKLLRVVNIPQKTFVEKPLPEGQGAWEVAFGSLGAIAFVTNEFLPPPGLDQHSISVVDGATHAEIHSIPVGQNPVGVVAAGNGQRAYVTNWGSDSVSVVDVELGQVVDTIAVGNRPWGIGLMGQQLNVQKSDWQDPRPVGWANHYEIRVQNNSGRMLHDVVLRDLLPPELQFLGDMDTGSTYDPASGHVIWSLGDLGPGDSRTVRLRFRSTSGVKAGDSVLNQVVASCLEGLVGYDSERTSFSEPPAPTPTWTSLPSSTPSSTPISTLTFTPTAFPSPTDTETATPLSTETRTPKAATPSPTVEATPAAGGLRVWTWHDLDADGQWDEDEPSLGGVSVSISGAGQNALTGTTGQDGQIHFQDMVPGDYVVRVGDVAGCSRTTSRSLKLGIVSLEWAEAFFGFRVPPRYLPAILSTR